MGVCLWVVSSHHSYAATVFEEAQEAAQAGRYRDVIDLLTKELEAGELSGDQLVTAYANRGIAYSLLKAYGLAKYDLRQAELLKPTHALTLNHLGLLSEQVDENYSDARSYYEKAVVQNFAASQVNLANIYYEGLGTEPDFKKAFELYQSAAVQNYSMALTPLGVMYAEGKGTKRNTKKAFELFIKASDAGVAAAHYQLALAYQLGRGTRRDLDLAVNNLRIAAMQGHGEAQNTLGYMYRKGRGVKQDYLEAATWYQLASEQGNAGAKNRLAWLLAGCPTERLCNGELAVQLANEAIEIDSDPGFVDSLAAAYARTGQFDLAIRTLEELLVGLPAGSPNAASYKRRMAIYSKGIPLQLK